MKDKTVVKLRMYVAYNRICIKVHIFVQIKILNLPLTRTEMIGNTEFVSDCVNGSLCNGLIATDC